MQVRLTRLASNNTAFRDDVIEGHAKVLPELGESFFMHAPGRDLPGSIRQVNTSPVTAIEPRDGSIIHFKSPNSLYRLEVLDVRST